jgi:hypothetical protein
LSVVSSALCIFSGGNAEPHSQSGQGEDCRCDKTITILQTLLNKVALLQIMTAIAAAAEETADKRARQWTEKRLASVKVW